jgi:acyl carrier protein
VSDRSQLLLRIVADVLGLPAVTAQDSFYDFGGTSLQAMRICTRVGRQLGSRLSPQVFFESDTLAEVVHALEVSLPAEPSTI